MTNEKNTIQAIYEDSVEYRASVQGSKAYKTRKLWDGGSKHSVVRWSAARMATNLQDMPVELLLEMFSYVLPRDLLILSRLCKSLRRLLLTKTSASTWRSTLELLGAPKCPSERVSIPRWVDLLFGGNFCSICGECVEYSFISSEIYGRRCYGCFDIETFKNHQFYPKHENSSRGVNQSIQSTTLFISESATKNLLKIYLDDARKSLPGSMSHSEAKSKNIQSAISYLEKTRIKKGHMDTLNRVVQSFQEGIRKNREDEFSWRLRFYLGWDNDDISDRMGQAMKGDDNCVNVFTWTEWNRLENRILKEQEEQIYNTRVRIRHTISKEVHEEYIATMALSQRASLPDWDVLRIQGPLKAYLEAQDIQQVHYTEFKTSREALINSIMAWKRPHIDRLTALLPQSFTERYKASTVTVTSNGYLDLAVAVFEREGMSATAHNSESSEIRHYSCNCSWNGGSVPLFGRQPSVSHRCRYPRDSRSIPKSSWRSEDWSLYPDKPVTFSERGSAAAALLVRILGLDEKTARPCDLDRKECRFFCDHCPAVYKEGKWMKISFSWRECVMHFMHPSVTETHGVPSWSMNKYQELYAAYYILESSSDRGFGLSCNLCAEDGTNISSMREVQEHLMIWHDIQVPVLSRDYFVNEYHGGSWLESVNPLVALEDVGPLYSCKRYVRCNGRLRRCHGHAYTLDKMISHLESRHMVKNPEMPRDCVGMKPSTGGQRYSYSPLQTNIALLGGCA